MSHISSILAPILFQRCLMSLKCTVERFRTHLKRLLTLISLLKVEAVPRMQATLLNRGELLTEIG